MLRILILVAKYFSDLKIFTDIYLLKGISTTVLIFIALKYLAFQIKSS